MEINISTTTGIEMKLSALPAEKDWLARQKVRVMLTSNIGGGKTTSVIRDSGVLDLEILRSIVVGELSQDLSGEEATQILNYLSSADVVRVVRAGDQWEVDLCCFGDRIVTHKLRRLSPADYRRYREEGVKTSERRGVAEVRVDGLVAKQLYESHVVGDIPMLTSLPDMVNVINAIVAEMNEVRAKIVLD